MKTLRIRIAGQVQGLGFRPYVYRLAVKMEVRGTVANNPDGVIIIAQGPQAEQFCEQLRHKPPPLAYITEFAVSRSTTRKRFNAFRIVPSSSEPSKRSSSTRVDVLPDLAICPDCRRELFSPRDRRYGYPFINCTNCGPRYTIIRTMPYDRPGTTMADFALCPDCRQEFLDPADRRFHAQPTACSVCGPSVQLLDRKGQPVECPDPVDAAARALAEGKTIAIRGLGGFHLACDARNDRAVSRLRRSKSRPAKPLALMVETVADARSFVRMSRIGRELLGSPAAPVVLLPANAAGRTGSRLSPGLAPDNDRLGVMLAYTPLHLRLFACLRNQAGQEKHDRKPVCVRPRTGRKVRHSTAYPPVLVMTSANEKDSPMIAEADELIMKLGRVFDLVLTHNRPIANRCDDSVVLAGRPPVMVRRARGYAPRPLMLARGFHVKHPTLAVGGDIRNCFCLAAGDRAWLSPHLGSMSAATAQELFKATLGRYRSWTSVHPVRIACDLHPDYSSTRFAEQLAAGLELPLYRVQHHFGHAVSALAQDISLRPTGLNGAVPTLALCFDGTGYGTDGAVWGCEFLLINPDLGWRRVGQLRYLFAPAGGNAVADPGRVAAAYLTQAGTGADKPVPFQGKVPCSSLGRLFDAVAAIAGVKRRVTFEGEAAVALETCFNNHPGRSGSGYRFPVSRATDGYLEIDPGAALLAANADARAGRPAGLIAARFHTGFVRTATAVARELVETYHLQRVVLTGGAFQNSFLRSGIAANLRARGLAVVIPELVPVNDGGLSLGQAVAAGRSKR